MWVWWSSDDAEACRKSPANSEESQFFPLVSVGYQITGPSSTCFLPHVRDLTAWQYQEIISLFFPIKLNTRVTGYSGVLDGCLGGVPSWFSIYKMPMSVVSQCFSHLLSGSSERGCPKLQLWSHIWKLTERLRRCCRVTKSVVVSGDGKDLSCAIDVGKGEVASHLVGAKFSLGTARSGEWNCQS